MLAKLRTSERRGLVRHVWFQAGMERDQQAAGLTTTPHMGATAAGLLICTHWCDNHLPGRAENQSEADSQASAARGDHHLRAVVHAIGK